MSVERLLDTAFRATMGTAEFIVSELVRALDDSHSVFVHKGQRRALPQRRAVGGWPARIERFLKLVQRASRVERDRLVRDDCRAFKIELGGAESVHEFRVLELERHAAATPSQYEVDGFKLFCEQTPRDLEAFVIFVRKPLDSGREIIPVFFEG